MLRNDFYKEVKEAAGLNNLNDAKVVTKAVFDTILKGMQDPDGVSPANGFKFEVVEKPARNGRNPQTGEALVIAAHKAPRCKLGKSIKDLVR